MSKRVKTTIIVILLAMALFQGPYFYYFSNSFTSLIFRLPFALIGLCLTVYVSIDIIKCRSSTSYYQIIGLIFAFILGCLTFRDGSVEYLDFRFRRSERDKIVREVKMGILKPNNSDKSNRCVLPEDRFLPISKGNVIAINKNDNGIASVEFCIEAGFLGSYYSAFLYTNDQQEINNLDKNALGFGHNVKKLDKNWYRIDD